jgi:hypothetical protein
VSTAMAPGHRRRRGGDRTPNPLIKRWNGLSAVLTWGFAGRRGAYGQESDALKMINSGPFAMQQLPQRLADTPARSPAVASPT